LKNFKSYFNGAQLLFVTVVALSESTQSCIRPANNPLTSTKSRYLTPNIPKFKQRKWTPLRFKISCLHLRFTSLVFWI